MRILPLLSIFLGILIIGCESAHDRYIQKVRRMAVHPDVAYWKLDATDSMSMFHPIVAFHSVTTGFHTYERRVLWRSLSDSTHDISETIDLIRQFGLEREDRDIYAILKDTYLPYYFFLKLKHGKEMPDSVALARINTALFKVSRNMDVIFDHSIVYDGHVDAWLDSRYIFLKNGELRKYTSFYQTTVEKDQWFAYENFLMIKDVDEDTTRYLKFAKQPRGFYPLDAMRVITYTDSL